ncbi:MAG: AAA family ATPase [Nitrospinae bacterium]|nr:AAA family ATPase [Nitrospinota bacterium]
MDSITLKNFRCFREEQTARLAPLTLLVGENSTGKTSFMAMVRALWDVCYRAQVPDFKEEPYDLGSYDEIAHHRGNSRADSFEAGFDFDDSRPSVAGFDFGGDEPDSDAQPQPCRFDVAFGKNGSAPVLKKMRLTRDDVWYEARYQDQSQEIRFGTPRGAWDFQFPRIGSAFTHGQIPFFFWYDQFLSEPEELKNRAERVTPQGPSKPADEDLKRIEQLGNIFSGMGFHRYRRTRPYAGTPVRSKPRRTYDPARPTPDPEGDYIPMHLAHLSHHDQNRWSRLKKALEGFGKEAGLFDEIHIRHLGKRDSEPFQLQVRKSGVRAKSPKGPWRNLIDMGYGVSQVLPVITELLEKDAPPMFLLQQPEVHLHPSAQAALGSLFCRVAGPERQLIVETHGDHLLSRVRMDVRDGVSDLKPEDVSILFFERDDLDVRIHSIRLDEEGNVRDAPTTYRKFFMEETRRSLWKR